MKGLKIFVILLILSLHFSMSAQNLIGYKAKDILQYMKEKHKEMVYEQFTSNSTYKYLKFSDREDTSTILFFLTPDSVCKAVRVVCDRSLRADKVKELDGSYTKKGEKSWLETRNGKSYIIEMNDEDWSFDITIRQIV